MTSISTEPPHTALTWKLVPAVLLSVSGVLLFGVENDLLGYSVLALSLVTAALIDREFLRHLALAAAGMIIISLVPLNADLSVCYSSPT